MNKIVETIVVKAKIAIVLMIVKNTSILDCDHFDKMNYLNLSVFE